MISAFMLLAMLQAPATSDAARTMEDCFAATTSLRSLQCVMVLSYTGSGAEQWHSTQSFAVQYESPHRIAVKRMRVLNTDVTHGAATPYRLNYPAEQVSTERVQYCLDDSSKRYTITHIVAKYPTELAGSASAFGDWTFGDIAFHRNHNYVADARTHGTVLPVKRIDGVQCVGIKVVRESDTSTYWVGLQDHLLRQAEMVQEDGTRTVESYKHVQANRPIADGAFRFKPPKNAERVKRM